jgi:hypothetical protein
METGIDGTVTALTSDVLTGTPVWLSKAKPSGCPVLRLSTVIRSTLTDPAETVTVTLVIPPVTF